MNYDFPEAEGLVVCDEKLEQLRITKSELKVAENELGKAMAMTFEEWQKWPSYPVLAEPMTKFPKNWAYLIQPSKTPSRR